MAESPPEGHVVPSLATFKWLVNTVYEVSLKQELSMATLSDLRQQALETRTRVEQLVEAEGAQSAALSGLGQSVDMLISLVQELRNGLSPEEQALADEAMADIGSALAAVSSTLEGTSDQSAIIADLAARAGAAGGEEEVPEEPEEPPVTPTP